MAANETLINNQGTNEDFIHSVKGKMDGICRITRIIITL